MITKGNAAAGAVFSDCESYRYRLWRVWDDTKPKACFVMLNPSTATHEVLDPTVTRCKKRAVALGYGGFEVVNIFALRSKDPKALYRTPDPVGPDNFQSIAAAVKDCAIAICAWGSHGKYMNVGAFIRDRMNQFFPDKFHLLALNDDDSPTHPLYLPYKLQPTLWSSIMDNTEKFRRECEARRVLQMSDEKRQAHYTGCLAKRGQAKVSELKAEVRVQEAKHVISLEGTKRQDYYQNVLNTHGQPVVDELIKEVKKQRRELSQEMTV